MDNVQKHNIFILKNIILFLESHAHTDCNKFSYRRRGLINAYWEEQTSPYLT
jgi:hypothetical protein